MNLIPGKSKKGIFFVDPFLAMLKQYEYDIYCNFTFTALRPFFP